MTKLNDSLRAALFAGTMAMACFFGCSGNPENASQSANKTAQATRGAASPEESSNTGRAPVAAAVAATGVDRETVTADGGASPKAVSGPSAPAVAVTPSVATKEMKMEYAVFGAGCFWGVEDAFQKVNGVSAVESGYAGGRTENPTYKEVCREDTGHAEVVRVTFDPSKVTYGKLCDIFFRIHDPTQVNRQGPDYGEQYRSVIFAADEAQMGEAKAAKERAGASGRYKRPIATKIDGNAKFYMAEEYHQDYHKKNGGSCHIDFDPNDI